MPATLSVISLFIFHSFSDFIQFSFYICFLFVGECGIFDIFQKALLKGLKHPVAKDGIILMFNCHFFLSAKMAVISDMFLLTFLFSLNVFAFPWYLRRDSNINWRRSVDFEFQSTVMLPF